MAPSKRGKTAAPPLPKLTLSTPEDVLAFVPSVLGFQPQDSLVMLSIAATGRAVHARLDFPRDPHEVAAVVHSLAGALTSAGSQRALLVIYRPDGDDTREIATRLCTAFDDAGFSIELLLGVDAEHYYWLLPGAPSEPVRYDVSTHPITLAAVVAGRVIYPSRTALASSLALRDQAAAAEVGRLAQERAQRLDRLLSDLPPGERSGALHWRSLNGVLAACAHQARRSQREAIAQGRPLTDTELAELLVALQSVDIRDVIWAELDQRCSAAWLRLWLDAVQRTPQDWVAPLAALLGFAAWLNGDGALAWCAVDRALAATPGYSMAELLGQLLSRAVPPDEFEPLRVQGLPLLTLVDALDHEASAV